MSNANKYILLLQNMEPWKRVKKIYELVSSSQISLEEFKKIMNHFWWIE